MTGNRRARSCFWVFAVLASAWGCNTGGVLSDHNETIQEAYQLFKQGRFGQAANEFSKNRGNKLDGLCFLFDGGTVRHTQGAWDQSIQEFEAAKQKMGGFDDRAKVSASDILETAGSFLVNEKTIPYKGEGFERVLLPCYQARNYFMRGDQEGALVEARRCLFQQGLVKDLYEEELRQAREQAAKKQAEVPGVDTGSFFSTIKQQAAIDPSYLSQPQSVYQIAFVDYVTAIMLEIDRDYENAGIFYRKVLASVPTSKTAQQDLARVEMLSGDIEGLNEVKSKYGVEPAPKDYGSVVVLFDCGEAPKKEQLSIPFPTGQYGFMRIAFPLYKKSNNPAGGLTVNIGGGQARTDLLSSVEQIAFRYFNDRIPLLVAKAIIRVLAKIAIEKTTTAVASKAERENRRDKRKKRGGKRDATADALGQLFKIGVAVTTSAILTWTEQADLRAWRTLPQNFQVARIYLPAGRYPVNLSLLSNTGGTLSQKGIGSITIKAGKTEILNVRSIGRDFWGAASPGLELAVDSGPRTGP